MTQISRRSFLAVAAAVAAVPVTPECARHMRVEVLTDGIWALVPMGLRAVTHGQHFRTINPDNDEVYTEATADGDGFSSTNEEGYACGAIYCFKEVPK